MHEPENNIVVKVVIYTVHNVKIPLEGKPYKKKEFLKIKYSWYILHIYQTSKTSISAKNQFTLQQNSPSSVTIFFLLRGKLRPAEVSDHVCAVANGYCPLIGHGDEGILHTDGILVQSHIRVLGCSVQAYTDFLTC